MINLLTEKITKVKIQIILKRVNKKKIAYVILISVLIIGLITNKVYWLALSVTIIYLVFVILNKAEVFNYLKRKTLLAYPLGFIGIIVLSIIIKVFFIGIYMVPSNSMENTIMPGDRVLANKLAYGSRTPVSPFEIPWLNILFYFNDNCRARINDKWWPDYRLNGYTKIKREDIVLFDLPGADMVIIKRCIALPGDSIKIVKGQVYLNNNIKHEHENTKLSCNVFYKDANKFENFCNSNGIIFQKNWMSNQNSFNVNTSYSNLVKIDKLSFVDSVLPDDNDTTTIYPFYPYFKWTKNDYGSVFIPKKGSVIELNANNFHYYVHLINRFEGVTISMSSDSVFVNNEYKKQYTFKNSYYWMMGDNRSYSQDSRYWGMIPEKNIIAKASIILFSKEYSGFKWNRLFKILK